jgi:poly(A) polymerase
VEPVDTIPVQPWMAAAQTRAVIAALQARGGTARFVGGCVRDSVAARPVRDIDIATPDAPDVVMALLKDAGVRVIPTGIDHGTVTAVIDGHHFEITTLRHDVETFGRRARVAFTDDWAADAARRDFTINALFADADGTLYDPTGGLADLRAGRVRFVGEAGQRIVEDALRILRFFRFFAYYGRGDIDAEGFRACRERAENIDILSGERICGEMLRLLAAEDPLNAVDLMEQAGVLAHIFPVGRNTGRLGAVVSLERSLGLNDALRRMAALLDTDLDGIDRVAGRLRMSNLERARLAGVAEHRSLVAPEMDETACRRVLYAIGSQTFQDVVLLRWAETGESHEGPYRALLAFAEHWRKPAFPLRGADVLDLGVSAGPDVGRLLDRVEAWWIDGDFRAGRDEALDKLKQLIAAQVR